MKVMGEDRRGSHQMMGDARESAGDDAAMQRRRRALFQSAAFGFGDQALFDDQNLANSGDKRSADSSSDKSADKSKSDGADNRTDAMLLAIAVGMNASPSPAPVPISPGTSVSLQVSADASHSVAIISRIEQALRASFSMGTDNPVSMQIRLDDLRVPGLNSVQILMTPKVLDVGFVRDAGTAGPELLAAAQSLAQQLAIKFPNRTVRVIDVDVDTDVGGEKASGSAGMRRISDLLTHRAAGG